MEIKRVITRKKSKRTKFSLQQKMLREMVKCPRELDRAQDLQPNPGLSKKRLKDHQWTNKPPISNSRKSMARR